MRVCVTCTQGPGVPGGLVVKNPPANAGDTRDTGSIPRLGGSPGEGKGNPLCLGDPTDRGASRATVHGVTNVRYAEHAGICQV